jgi:AcrR family transcriptional regulator
MAKRSLEPRQERARKTLGRLLGATERAIASDGLRGFDLRSVCHRAGVTTGALYARFPDKLALLGALFDELDREARSAVEEFLADAAGEKFPDARAAVAAFVAGIARVYTTRGTLISALLEGSYDEPALRRRAVALIERATAALAFAVDPGNSRPSDDARLWFAARLAFAWFDHRLHLARCRAKPIAPMSELACLEAAMVAALEVPR